MVSPWWEFAVAREERAGPRCQVRVTSLNLLNLETGSALPGDRKFLSEGRS